MFDGEAVARRGIELLGGITLNQLDVPEGYQHVPSILFPRYYINNKEPVRPHVVHLSQLNDPNIVKLQRKLEDGDLFIFGKLVLRKTLASKAGELTL